MCGAASPSASVEMRRECDAIGWLGQIVADGECAETVPEMATEPGVVLPPPWRPDAAELAQCVVASVGTGGAIEVEAVDEAARDIGFGELGTDQIPETALSFRCLHRRASRGKTRRGLAHPRIRRSTRGRAVRE
jgi:hypothetical protein